MKDVFISYSHEDAEIREAVAEKLESAGISCWYAPRDIQPGVEWADTITSGLKSCRILLLIFTQASNASNQVLREVGLAVDFKMPIIPLRCDETELSGSMQYYLSTLQWMDLSQDNGAPLDELPDLVRKRLSEEKRSETAVPSGPEKKPVNRKLIFFIAALIITLNIVLGIVIYKKAGGGEEKPTAETQLNSYLEQLIAAGVTLADGGDIRSIDLSSTQSTIVNNKLYYFSTDNDSPGAENYLFTLLEDDTIRIDDYNGEKQSEITLPEVIDGLPVTEIGESCFENDLFLEKVIMPETVDYVRVSAFAGCSNLKEVVFSKYLVRIDEQAFANSGLTGAIFPDTLELIEPMIFLGCENLETVFLPKKITLIPNGAFQNTPNLKTVTISAEKVLIDKDAFDYTPDLTLIGVPNSYTETYAKQRGIRFSGIRD